MRSLILFLCSCVPMIAFAQGSLETSDAAIIFLIVGVLAVLAIFVLLTRWLFRIDHICKRLDELVSIRKKEVE